MSAVASYSRYPRKRQRSVLFYIFILLALAFVAAFAAKLFQANSSNSNTSPYGDPSFDNFVMLTTEESYPVGTLAEGLMFDKLVLIKSERRLTAYVNNTPVRVYLVALGKNPVGRKEFQGDYKTPEGDYRIDDRNPNSAYYKNVNISYPDGVDTAHARQMGKDPGGAIKIHGLPNGYGDIGEAHRITDWTHGCVAVTNEEMEEIYQRTPLGTLISIKP